LQQVTQEIALAAPSAPGTESDENYWREERVQRGDSVASLLARLDVHDPVALDYLRGTRETRSLYQVVPGRTVRAVTSGDGQLISLRYMNSYGAEVVVRRRGETFFSTQEQPAQEKQVLMASGEIETSLFEATDAAGLGEGVALQLADIFSSEVDFHRDLQRGDRFSVVYEAVYADGELVKSGRVLAAQFINQGQTYRAVYFQDEHGKGGYYTPNGKNMRKAYLRSPLELSRITSGFTSARLHPLLNVMRAHKGVDYGAPVGTRVRATADGVVRFAGYRGGYGKVVEIEHRNGQSTLYAHLSSVSGHAAPGQRISQGEVIGFVGMTGLATGPHLHYEFLVNGVHINPLGQPMPAASPISRELRAQFERASTPLLDRLDLVAGVNVAAFH
jgi:murein DD-endopeptidase MepM/ murein hydrolase activator NlpD